MMDAVRRRQRDGLTIGLVVVALTQLIIVGTVHGAAAFQRQDVINQRHDDRIESMTERVLRLEGQVSKLSDVPATVATIAKDQTDIHALLTALLIGVALNFIGTIVQIRTRPRNRRPPETGGVDEEAA